MVFNRLTVLVGRLSLHQISRPFFIPAISGKLRGTRVLQGGFQLSLQSFSVDLNGCLGKSCVMIETPTDVNAIPGDAEITQTGLAFKILVAGNGGEQPAAADTVTVHYSGWTTDGKLFDSSVQRGQSTSFPLNQVIKGWTEGLQLMTIGEKRRFWIPAALAYGENAGGGRPRGMLVFDVELLAIKAAPKPPEVPVDVAAAPDSAEVTKSGLASRMIKAGTGSQHPSKSDMVTVHYSGWTTDGKLFDSSVARGEPTSFGLFQVIAGWTEGVQLMVEGETRRFWIPGKLAYGEKPQGGAPGGTLVFDVELIKIGK
jgi:FKBP-type peptidyl-prolyl cis-trans isomerase